MITFACLLQVAPISFSISGIENMHLGYSVLHASGSLVLLPRSNAALKASCPLSALPVLGRCLERKTGRYRNADQYAGNVHFTRNTSAKSLSSDNIHEIYLPLSQMSNACPIRSSRVIQPRRHMQALGSVVAKPGVENVKRDKYFLRWLKTFPLVVWWNFMGARNETLKIYLDRENNILGESFEKRSKSQMISLTTNQEPRLKMPF